MVFLVSALFFTAIICADQAVMTDGTVLQVKTNDKLLIPLVVSKRQNAFEQGMAESGWDIHKPQNLAFYNVRQIIARNEIMNLQDEMDKKIASQYRTSRAVDSSA